MLLSDNDTKEELSRAYVHTIATRAGFSVSSPKRDNDSVDMVIAARGKLTPDCYWESPSIALQLKATSLKAPATGTFSFSLPVKNYNDLRGRRMQPRLLIVLVLPPDKNAWVIHTRDSLVIGGAAYWCNLAQLPDVGNKKTKNITIDCKHILAPKSLWELMLCAAKQEPLTL